MWKMLNFLFAGTPWLMYKLTGKATPPEEARYADAVKDIKVNMTLVPLSATKKNLGKLLDSLYPEEGSEHEAAKTLLSSGRSYVMMASLRQLSICEHWMDKGLIKASISNPHFSKNVTIGDEMFALSENHHWCLDCHAPMFFYNDMTGRPAECGNCGRHKVVELTSGTSVSDLKKVEKNLKGGKSKIDVGFDQFGDTNNVQPVRYRTLDRF